jgi:hypothetical protein
MSSFRLLPDAAYQVLAAECGLGLRDLCNLAEADTAAALSLAELDPAAYLPRAAACSLQHYVRLWRERRTVFRAEEALWMREVMDDSDRVNAGDDNIPFDSLTVLSRNWEDEGWCLDLAYAVAHDPNIIISAVDVFNIYYELPLLHRQTWFFRTLDGGRHGRDSLPNSVALALKLGKTRDEDPRFRGHPTLFAALRDRLLTPECLADTEGWAADSVLDAGCPLWEVVIMSEVDVNDRLVLEGQADEWNRVSVRAATGVLAAVHAAWMEHDAAGWRKFTRVCKSVGNIRQLVEMAVDRVV